MNEDNDLNESLKSENQNQESAGMSQPDANADSAEGMGEAAISAAQNSARIKSAKFFKKKKAVDDVQDEKIKELTNDLQRTRADFENFRRQTELQKEQYGNVVKYATINKVLPLIDDMERAIAANPDTLGPLQKNLEKTILNLGLTKISAEPGEAFNPDLHDAVMVEGDGENEVIAESLRAGYYYEGQVIRPTMVKVSKQ